MKGRKKAAPPEEALTEEMEGADAETKAEEVKFGFKDRAASFVMTLKKPKTTKVMVPSGGSSHEDEDVTPIPKVAEKHLNEIEIIDVDPPYSFVRVLYNTMANDYYYEALEPPLTEDERDLVAVLKEAIIDGMERTEVEDLKEKKVVLRGTSKRMPQMRVRSRTRCRPSVNMKSRLKSSI